tara:strand:- start:327 stop:485 length:159 start_codon:yes stop_codon:yes gene_type:complete
MLFETTKVGMTGFEPATTRPPAVHATGLHHIPILELQIKQLNYNNQSECGII